MSAPSYVTLRIFAFSLADLPAWLALGWTLRYRLEADDSRGIGAVVEGGAGLEVPADAAS